MSSDPSNTYHFSCQVVEIIYKEEQRIIKAICNPGSLIIETPDVGKAQLGDRLLLSGTFQIDTVKFENS
ncbi:MAG: hypothetical protein ABFS38_18510 [Bacteroidota bacterium]